MSFCFIFLRETISAEGLIVVYACPEEYEVESFPRQWLLNCSLQNLISQLPAATEGAGGRNRCFSVLLKNCSVEQEVNCIPHSDSAVLAIFLVVAVRRPNSEHP